MTDPVAVFNAAPGRHGTLKVLWPELYAALAGKTADGEGAVPRVRLCELSIAHEPLAPNRPPAVGRVFLNGPAACRDCLGSRKPYPLKITDPRTYRT